jgi:hypothetical protein
MTFFSFSLSLRNRSADDLCPEEPTLRPLNHLLVHALRWMVHDHRPLLVVDLRIHPCVPNKIDDPLLSLVLAQVQPLRKILNVDPLMDLAVALGNEMPCRVHKRLSSSNQEEIALQNLLRFTEFALCLLEVEINAKGSHKLGDRILIFVQFLLDNTHKVLELFLVLTGVTVAVAVGDNSGSNVAEDPRAGGLNGVDEGGGEEKLDESITGRVVIEKGEEDPVNQPCSMLELGERVVVELSRNVNHVPYKSEECV